MPNRKHVIWKLYHHIYFVNYCVPLPENFPNIFDGVCRVRTHVRRISWLRWWQRAALSSRQSAHQSKPGDNIAKLSSVIHKVRNSGCLDIESIISPNSLCITSRHYCTTSWHYKCELTITSGHCWVFGIAFSMPQAPKCGALWSVNKLHAGSRGIASCHEF